MGDHGRTDATAAPALVEEAAAAPPPKPRRRVVRRKRRARNSGPSPSDVPDSIAKNPALLSAINATIPSDYEFEVCKTIHRINLAGASHVALQLPEGLLMYACGLADLIRTFSEPGCAASVSILGDVTYGACCVDDLSAKALGCDLLVHYGHSCLVPVTETAVPCLYVFVEIRIDVSHLVGCLEVTCSLEGTAGIYVMGTVQFRSAVVEASKRLAAAGYVCEVPQAKPLSPGEVLGCTAPAGLAEGLEGSEGGGKEKVMLFVADGRFHLEAAMISNPTLRALRYDPYGKTLTDERYETDKMKAIRRRAMKAASDPDVKVFGVVLGTLGRQGNPAILGQVRSLLRAHGRKSFVLLLSEIYPHKLDMMPKVDAWVQIACPRLSVDWGHFFTKPMLSPFELHVALGEAELGKVYPMDFYRNGSGPWTNYHGDHRSRRLGQ